jgi:hypothetical protein
MQPAASQRGSRLARIRIQPPAGYHNSSSRQIHAVRRPAWPPVGRSLPTMTHPEGLPARRRLAHLSAQVSAQLPAHSGGGGGGGSSRRPLRLAIGKLQQETNDLSPVHTTAKMFRDFGFHPGPATLVGAGREGSVEGFLTAVEAWDTP